jgi:hypothetical protein
MAWNQVPFNRIPPSYIRVTPGIGKRLVGGFDVQEVLEERTFNFRPPNTGMKDHKAEFG